MVKESSHELAPREQAWAGPGPRSGSGSGGLDMRMNMRRWMVSKVRSLGIGY